MNGMTLLRCICDETRFSILDRLSRGEMAVGEIARELERDQPLISHHLKTLKECGIVSAEVRGRCTMYGITNKRIADLIRQIQQAGNEINDICDDAMCCAK